MRFLAHAALAVAVTGTSVADTPHAGTATPRACAQFSKIPGGARSPVAWDHLLSYAACMQDASVPRIDYAFQLVTLVEQLEAALAPSLALYIMAIQTAPGPIKLRAAYQVGMSQVALMTRARLAIRWAPELRDQLEPTLETPARLAWAAFAMMDRVVTADPSLSPDVVTRAMVRSARTLEAVLAREWRFDADGGDLRELDAQR